MNFRSVVPWWLSDYKGARWVRCDLHLHSPGVASFACPSGLDPLNADHLGAIVKDIVGQLHTEGIEMAALTDYNGVREQWFHPIREEAEKVGITVFPGAELTFASGSAGKHGLHLIAIFDPTIEPGEINRAIAGLEGPEVKPLFDDKRGHRNIEVRGGFEESIQELVRAFTPRPLIVVAHPNDDKGLLKTYAAAKAAGFIDEVRPNAIESFDPGIRERLLSSGKVHPDTLDRIAGIESSDPKCIEEIGTKTRSSGQRRATYLKLSCRDDIEAIRLALGDPEVMVRVGSAPESRYTRILATEIEGGFLDGMRVVWSPELTNAIGGRGVGKSALLETVRYALAIEAFAETDYRVNLVKHSIGSGGKVCVWFERFTGPSSRTRRYRIERIYGQPPRVFEIDSISLKDMPTQLHPHDVMGEDGLPLIFGQREIYSIATDQSGRMKLVDDIIGAAASEGRADMRELRLQLEANASEVLRLRRYLLSQDELKGSLRSVNHEIEVYEKEGLTEKLGEMTRLSVDETALLRIVRRVDQVSDALQGLHTEVKDYKEEAARFAAQAKSACRSIVQKASGVVDNLANGIVAAIEPLGANVRQAKQNLLALETEWRRARVLHDEAIRKIKQELGTQTLDPDRLEYLTRQRVQLTNQLTVLEKAEEDLNAVLKLRGEMLRRLRDSRHAIFRTRRKQAASLTDSLNGQVKIDVEYMGNAEEYLDQLRACFSGSGVDRSSQEKLCSSVDMAAADGQQIAAAVAKGADEVVRQFGVSTSWARRIVDWLPENEERYLRLQMLAPDDKIQISMMIDGKEMSVDKMSDGQRATAILMILLQQDRPLIIDQPEDDLDNRFIYEGVVRLLRAQKGKRQVIAATHNPNIPVLGNAELILALETRNGKSTVSDAGSIDQGAVRETVKRVMEGGEDAFRRRAAKYGAM